MNWVTRRRGMRLVRRKFKSSCWEICRRVDRMVVMMFSPVQGSRGKDDDGLDTHTRDARCTGLGVHVAKVAESFVAFSGQAPLARWPLAHFAAACQALALLRVRRGP